MPYVIGNSTAFGSHRNPIIFCNVQILPECLENSKHMQKNNPENFMHLISDERYRNRKKYNFAPHTHFVLLYENLCTYGVWFIGTILFYTAIFELLLEYIFIYYFPHVCVSRVSMNHVPPYMEHRKSDYELYVRKSEDLVSHWGWAFFFFF